jgi:hypothetical protein
MSKKKLIFQVLWDMTPCRWVFFDISKVISAPVFNVQVFQAFRYSEISFFLRYIALKMGAIRSFEASKSTH